MIVNSTENGYDVITHYAHGLQAAQIAIHINEEIRPQYWTSMLCAIIEHDDEQLNFERNNNVSKAGKPLDFTMIDPVASDILTRCERVLEMAQHRSGWVTLMIALHLEFLYKDMFPEDNKLNSFFEKLHEIKKKQRSIYKLNEAKSVEFYEILRFCDRVSLILASNEIPANGRKLEINKSINGVTYFLSKVNDKIMIEPWPFNCKTFVITTEVYELPNKKFKNSNDLQTFLLDHYPILKTWELSCR